MPQSLHHLAHHGSSTEPVPVEASPDYGASSVLEHDDPLPSVARGRDAMSLEELQEEDDFETALSRYSEDFPRTEGDNPQGYNPMPYGTVTPRQPRCPDPKSHEEKAKQPCYKVLNLGSCTEAQCPYCHDPVVLRAHLARLAAHLTDFEKDPPGARPPKKPGGRSAPSSVLPTRTAPTSVCHSIWILSMCIPCRWPCRPLYLPQSSMRTPINPCN